MNYPQGYILLKKSTKLPPLNVLQAWFETKREIYVRNVSRTSRILNHQISRFEELHRFAFDNDDLDLQCIVFSGTAVSPAFIWAHIEDIVKVYWIDSPHHALEIHNLDMCIKLATNFHTCLVQLEIIYNAISEFIYWKRGQRPVGDDALQRYFAGRHWGVFSEAEVHVKQIARNETRAGILRRIDLEGAGEAISADQPAPP
jgi:hypothetical protein